MQQRFAIYIILAFLILLAACSRRPSYVISEKKMVDVLYDIQLAQAIYNTDKQFFGDENKDALVESVLQKYKITQAELDSSLLWYADNIGYYEVISDSVASKLRAQSNLLAQQSQSAKGTGPLLIIPRLYKLTVHTPTLSFVIDSAKMKDIDVSKFSLRFDVQGVNRITNIETSLFFTYKDTVVQNTLDVNTDSRYSLHRPNLPDSLLKSISGYIHMKGNMYDIPRNVLLYNISYLDSVSVAQDSLETTSPQVSLPAVPTRRPVPDNVKPVTTKENLTDKPALK
ncbi:DUF4296 domain-containing protein [Dysgonomonas sp. 511]|uniref:DUF4296 domain-containing protein n=1 Tax=Dysgonomonas sp. 511 TaxID=2302930 RepID=UPI0013D57526|nr:DUF4296 domain-containing protein [Dysgonomonas sp. 511]NDV78528.1 DUF4296 domain-containing protein [Dysgonomonas sp. 511]